MVKQYEKYKTSKYTWFDNIPNNWQEARVSYYFEIGRGRVIAETELVEDGLYPVYSSQTKNNGCLGFINTYDFDDNILTWTTDGANAGSVFKRDGKFNCTNVCGTLKPKKDINLNYYLYFLQFVTQFYKRPDTNGAKIMNNEMAAIQLLVPTIQEQTQIARYLDYKTGIIDQLISKKQKLIELLKEKRQAVINEAVTKGLNPKAKMKDSGIEWLGEIPEHWSVARIGHYSQIIRGASPRPAGDPSLFGSEFMPWITVAEVTNGNDKFLYSTSNYLTELGSKQSRIIYPETLLLSNSGATLGVPKISKITGCINDGSVAFISFNKNLERDFLYYFFITHTETYRSEMAGYGQPNLNTDIIKSTKIPLPPIEEQYQIINHIESTLNDFEILFSNTNLQIEKLKEYRQSIISEAVTGKIDVRDWEPNKQEVA